MSKTARLNDLVIWDENYNEGDVGAIARSIRALGFNQVIRVWKGNQVRAGNHTVLALREIQRVGHLPDFDLSWPPEHVTVDAEGYWYVPVMDISHLDEERALAFAIADNRIASLASQDDTMLAAYLTTLFNHNVNLLLSTGFNPDELNDLLDDITTGLETDMSEFQAATAAEIQFRIMIGGFVSREEAEAFCLEYKLEGADIQQYRGRGDE